MAKKSPRKSAKVAKKSATARSAATTSRVGSASQVPASRRIDQRIQELGGWRAEVLERVRRIVMHADPQIIEEWKWQTPVWACNGILCTGEAYKNVVKMTFARGASLKDPSRLFNSSLDGKVRRAIDIHEGEKVNESALKDLVLAAVALNLEGKTPSAAVNSAE